MDEKEKSAEQSEITSPETKPEQPKEDKNGKAKTKPAKKDKNADKGRVNGPEEPFFKNRRNVIRLVLFGVAVIIAVSAIATGVYQATNKEPGYYTVDLQLDDSVPYYSSGVTFYYYFEGSSDEIKAEMRALTEAYTSVMKRSFKMLDSANVYPDVTSIAEINNSPGKEIEVSDELYAVLCDAVLKTYKINGYNMFAGLLYGFWDELLYSSDPVEFDPINSAEQNELYQKIYEVTNDPDSFHLVLDANTAKLIVSDRASALIDEYGLEYPIIDLNLLYDAYRYDIVCGELAAKGYTKGYLYTDDGLTVTLADNGGNTKYLFYALYEETPYMAAFVDGVPGSAAVMFRSFAFGEEDIGFYKVGSGDNAVYRHKFQPSVEDSGVVLSVMTVIKNGIPLADAAALDAGVYACASAEEVFYFVSDHAEATFFVSFKDEPAVVYTNSPDEASVFEEYVTVKLIIDDRIPHTEEDDSISLTEE